ncbi:MAG: hypothetical protein ACREXY_25865 [Gammaproteobacteria bacterium]
MPHNVVVELSRPTKPDEGWLVEDFWQWAQFKRQDELALPVERGRPKAFGAWWTTVLSEGFLPADIRRGFVVYSQDPYWQKTSPPLPVAGFVSQWFKYTAREDAHAAG